MTDFAWVNPEGFPTGGGRVPDHRPVPDGATVIDNGFSLDDLSRIRWTGSYWVEHTDLLPIAPPTEVEIAAFATQRLARARAEAMARINTRVGALRLRVYTDIPGQDALYLEKRAEALRYVGLWMEPLVLDDFPLLANEVGITAPTAWQLAQIWLHRSDQFKALGAATERTRLSAAKALAEAPDEDTISAIEQGFVEALSQLPL